MKYDFNHVPDRRGCGSYKWNGMPDASPERVPLSTADMEFYPAPEITEALKNLVDTTVLGYTSPTEDYYAAVCGWMKRRHNFDVDPSEILLTPGVVTALGLLVATVTEPGDNVIVMPPVYYPFDLAVLAKGRNIVYCPLQRKGDRYEIDFDKLAELAAEKKNSALLLCNPHNPVGRVWSPEELSRLVDICADNGVFIIDDEIHHDLILPGYKHTVLVNANPRARDICAICTAPSKTFNLAGLQCSNIIIPNAQVRGKANMIHLVSSMSFHLNIFAYTACKTAYNCCEGWLEELLQVIQQNADYIKAFCAQHFPGVKVYPLEGTYLLWADFSSLGMTHYELEDFMKAAGLYLDEGYIFGEGGRGFERFNLACAPVTIERTMDRLLEAWNALQAKWAAKGKPYHKTLAAGDKLEGFVYDTAADAGIDLAQQIEKPTLLLFSRYYSCSICQSLMSELRQAMPELNKLGLDLKVVLQSTRESIAEQTKDAPFPFELICDPEAKLYDRYNVFQADSLPAMIAGDPLLEQLPGGVMSLLGSAFGGGKTEGRQRQLPALFAVTPDMTVKYAHYGRTLTDLPDLQEAVQALLK